MFVLFILVGMYNNYGNPYYQPQRFQPQFTPQTNNPTMPTFSSNSLQGKQVDSLEVVRATDVPFDGSISYFPLTDGSAIVTKQLQMDGTSKIVVFKPMADKINTIKYITQDDLDGALNNIKDEIDKLKEQLKKEEG